jgi:hypothetical protein
VSPRAVDVGGGCVIILRFRNAIIASFGFDIGGAIPITKNNGLLNAFH